MDLINSTWQAIGHDSLRPAMLKNQEVTFVRPAGEPCALELLLQRVAAGESMCMMKLCCTARTVEVLEDDGCGKFSYITSARGMPTKQLADACEHQLMLPASASKIKLRLLSLLGPSKQQCTIYGLHCTQGDVPASDNDQSESTCSAPTKEALSQAAQLRMLLQHATQPGNQDGLLPDGLHELGAKISQAPGLASAIARSALSSIPPAPTAQAAPQQQPSFTASPNTDQGQEQARKQSFLDGLSGGGGGLVALGTQMFGLMQQMDARLQCIEKAVGAVHSRLDKLEQMVLANNKGRNA